MDTFINILDSKVTSKSDRKEKYPSLHSIMLIFLILFQLLLSNEETTLLRFCLSQSLLTVPHDWYITIFIIEH